MCIETDKITLITLFTSLYGVIHCKIIPVQFLVRGQHPRAVAQRTDTSQCLYDRRTDKFRSVWYFLDDLIEVLINLERYNLLFFHNVLTQTTLFVLLSNTLHSILNSFSRLSRAKYTKKPKYRVTRGEAKEKQLW